MIAFYPGSFDPITKGHLDIIRRSLVFSPQLVIGVGYNLIKKTLFSADERVDLINQALVAEFTSEELARISVTSFTGATVEYADYIGAKLLIKGLRGATDFAYEEKMAIVNHRLAPHLESVFLFTDNKLRDVSSSVVKEMATAGITTPEKYDHYLTSSVRNALLDRIKSS